MFTVSQETYKKSKVTERTLSLQRLTLNHKLINKKNGNDKIKKHTDLFVSRVFD